jgi:hypothetical protein
MHTNEMIAELAYLKAYLAEAEATANLYQVELKACGEEQLRRSDEHSRQLTAATSRAEALEKERDEAVRENARLREGIKRVACDWDRKSSDVYGLVAGEDGKAIRAVVDGFSALLAQPEEVKDGT